MEADRDRTLREMSVGELLASQRREVCRGVRSDRSGDLVELGDARRQTPSIGIHPSLKLTRG